MNVLMRGWINDVDNHDGILISKPIMSDNRKTTVDAISWSMLYSKEPDSIAEDCVHPAYN